MKILYIFSIAFQVAGAVLLMFLSLSTNRRKVINRFINKNMIFSDGNTKKLTYDKDEFKNIFKQSYLANFSFLYIIVGYILGIFGNTEGFNNWLILIFVVIVTIILIGLAYFIVMQIIKHSKNINREITNEELEKLDTDEVKSDLHEIALKKYKILSKRENDNYKLSQKLFRFLVGKGYDYDLIKDVIKSIVKSEDF